MDDSKSSSIKHRYRYYLLAVQTTWHLMEHLAGPDFWNVQLTACHIAMMERNFFTRRCCIFSYKVTQRQRKQELIVFFLKSSNAIKKSPLDGLQYFQG